MLRVVLVAGVLCLASDPGLAAPDRVIQLKEDAYKAFEVGRYGQAIRAMEEAYQLQRDPRLLYNLALFYFKRYELKAKRPDLIQSRELFRRFLVLVPVSLGRSTAERRKLIKTRRLAGEYVRKIKQLARTAPTATQPSRPTSRPVVETHQARRDTPSRDDLFHLLPPAKVSEKKRSSRRFKGAWHWVLYGVGATALTAAVVTGALAVDSANDAEAAAARLDVDSNHQYADRTDALALSTDVFIGCAVAAVAAGLVLHIVYAKRRTRVSWSSGESLLSVKY